MALDALRSGFVTLCFDTSLNFVSGRCRLLLEGQYLPAGLPNPAAADTVLQITSERDIDDLLGAGSILAEAVRHAFCTCPSGSDIFVLPRPDAVGAVQAQYTITIGGPATSDGTFSLFMLDEEYSVDVIVLNGDTAATIATNVAAALPPNFPYTAVVVGNVITLTARNGGTVGNFLTPIYNWRGLANYAPDGVTVAVAQTVVGSVDPAPLDYADVLGECCYDCHALLSGNLIWQRGVRDHIRSNWDCTKPQCFGHGYTYNNGTLGQVLATGDNSPEFSRLAYPVNDANPPWLLVAAYAALSCCTACDNWELSIQGREHGLLSCIKRPTSCVQPWSNDDREALQEAGFVVYGPNTLGTGFYTNPYIYNDVTNYLYDELNRPNFTYRSTIHRRWAKAFGVTFADFMENSYNGTSVFKDGTQIRPGVFGTTKNMIRAKIIAWLRTQEGVTISAIENIDEEVKVFSDFEVKPPCQGVPGEYIINMLVRPPVRASVFRTVIAPKLIDNCERSPRLFS